MLFRVGGRLDLNAMTPFSLQIQFERVGAAEKKIAGHGREVMRAGLRRHALGCGRERRVKHPPVGVDEPQGLIGREVFIAVELNGDLPDAERLAGKRHGRDLFGGRRGGGECGEDDQ